MRRKILITYKQFSIEKIKYNYWFIHKINAEESDLKMFLTLESCLDYFMAFIPSYLSTVQKIRGSEIYG